MPRSRLFYSTASGKSMLETGGHFAGSNFTRDPKFAPVGDRISHAQQERRCDYGVALRIEPTKYILSGGYFENPGNVEASRNIKYFLSSQKSALNPSVRNSGGRIFPPAKCKNKKHHKTPSLFSCMRHVYCCITCRQ